MKSRSFNSSNEFDSFCKKVLKNEAVNFHLEMKRKQEREKTFSELSSQEARQLCINDNYFVTEQIFFVQGNEIVIRNYCIAKALRRLPEKKRDIIILSYFLELSDREIGERLNLIRTTVQYQRCATLELLKKILKEGQADE